MALTDDGILTMPVAPAYGAYGNNNGGKYILEEKCKDKYCKARTDEHVGYNYRNDHLDVCALVHDNCNIKSGILLFESVYLIDTCICYIVCSGFTALEYA